MLSLELLSFVFVFVFGRKYVAVFVFVSVSFSAENVKSVFGRSLHGSPAAGVSQSLRRGTRNGITEHSQRAPSIFGRAVITLGIDHIVVAQVCCARFVNRK